MALVGGQLSRMHGNRSDRAIVSTSDMPSLAEQTRWVPAITDNPLCDGCSSL